MARFSFVLPAMVGLAVSVSTIALAAEGGNWAGAYGGLHVGYGFSSNDNVKTSGQAAGNIANVASGARPASVSVDPDGLLGGVALGYNMQSDNFVYGVEADIDLTDLEDSQNVNNINPASTPPGAALINSFKQDLEYLGTLRLRLGVAVNGGNTLVYATGGLAYGGVKVSGRFSGPLPANVTQFSGSNDETETGYVIGAGLEHAIDANLRLTGSYMYYDLGSNTVNVAAVPGSGAGGTGYNSKFDTSGHLLRAGVGYKF